MTIPVAGEPAPDLALPDEHGVLHRLTAQRGRWTVVYFYPEDDTVNCTIEACGFRDANEEIEGLGATVWGISPDGAESHRRFRARHDLNFALLVDEGHAVAERYGLWVEKKRPGGGTYMGVQRATFLVGPDGRIAVAWPRVVAQGHAGEVAAAIAAAKAGS